MNSSQISARIRGLNRWELLFLIFLVAFGVVLSYNLAYKSILWDETPHLYGSLLLSQGRVGEYLGVTFYPPLFDGVTAGFFAVFGASLWLGRFISVVFALLTLAALFKLADRAYGRRVALLSCIFMAAMPAFIWAARLSILETALEFFLVLCFWLFLEWLHRGNWKIALLSGFALGFAFLIKYQAVNCGAGCFDCVAAYAWQRRATAEAGAVQVFHRRSSRNYCPSFGGVDGFRWHRPVAKSAPT
jgi:dolichyl-phosphate-mannose--protein O-mannosyl transferase